MTQEEYPIQNTGNDETHSHNEVTHSIDTEQINPVLFGNMFSALSNNEIKCIILAGMDEGISYTDSMLYSRVADLLGGKCNYPFTKQSFSMLVHNSLVPIGLVVKETNPLLYRGANTYRKTDLGVSLGDPLAGILLFISEQYPQFPLLNVFGKTGSSGYSQNIQVEGLDVDYKKRSPEIRLNILKFLANNHLPVRQEEIMDSLGLSTGAIFDHLKQLKRFGVIEYDSPTAGIEFAHYQVKDDRSENDFDIRTKPFTKLVYSICKDSIQTYGLTNHDILGIIQDTHPETLLGIDDPKFLIKCTINHLLLKGYIESNKFAPKDQSKLIGRGSPSIIQLNREQQMFINLTVDLLDLLIKQNNTVIEFGKNQASQILSDPTRVDNLFLRSRNSSPYTLENSTAREVTANNILYLISTGNYSTEEVRIQLEAQFHRSLSNGSVRMVLKDLEKAGLASPCGTKHVRHWKRT